MDQEACEEYALDKKESEDYHYIKEIKTCPEPRIGPHHGLFHYGCDEFCTRARNCQLP